MQVGILILIGGILKRGHKGGKNGSKLIISRDGSVLFPFFVSFGLYLASSTASSCNDVIYSPYSVLIIGELKACILHLSTIVLEFEGKACTSFIGTTPVENFGLWANCY